MNVKKAKTHIYDIYLDILQHDVDYKKEPLLKTIHLYELIDAIMERYENDNKR